jgi:hypothetical protein
LLEIGMAPSCWLEKQDGLFLAAARQRDRSHGFAVRPVLRPDFKQDGRKARACFSQSKQRSQRFFSHRNRREEKEEKSNHEDTKIRKARKRKKFSLRVLLLSCFRG